MWIDGVGWAPRWKIRPPRRIVGKVGYTVVPAGPKGHYSATYGDGIGIAAASKTRGRLSAACQWVVSKKQGARLLQAGGGVPFRMFRPQRSRDPEGRKCRRMAAVGDRFCENQQARPACCHSGRRIPRSRRCRHQPRRGRRRSRDELRRRTSSTRRSWSAAKKRERDNASNSAAAQHMPRRTRECGRHPIGRSWCRALGGRARRHCVPMAVHDLDELQ